MPVVEIHILEGRTDEMKENLISSVTKAVQDSLQVPASNIRVILDEMKAQHFAVNGESAAAKLAREGKK
jgi:4-oxalocrotonate tautomerase